MLKNTKAQTQGLVSGLIFGIASLVVAVIICFLIVATLSDADLLTSSRTTTTVTNESAEGSSSINATGYQLTGLDANYIPGTITITGAFNYTEHTAIVVVGNITVSSTGIVTNASVLDWKNASISYTSSVYSNEEVSEEALTGNFTAGVDNVSGKIPTVLLIAAIVLILGVLVLLVGAWQRMRIGGGSI